MLANMKRPAFEADVLTLAETSRLLQVCEKTAARLAKSGDLPARRVGNQWRFSRRAVLAHIEGETIERGANQ